MGMNDFPENVLISKLYYDEIIFLLQQFSFKRIFYDYLFPDLNNIMNVLFHKHKKYEKIGMNVFHENMKKKLD